MSFIGEMLKSRIQVDGAMVRVIGRFGFAFETVAGTSGGAALSLAKVISFLTTTSGNGGFTLANGTYTGQIKIVSLTSLDTTSAVITPANFGGGSTVTFDTEGEGGIFMWDGSNWQLIAAYGEAIA